MEKETFKENGNRTLIKNTLKSRNHVADNNIQNQNSYAMLHHGQCTPIPDARNIH